MSSQQEAARAQREAVDTTVPRIGPTADRYRSAFERRLAAVPRSGLPPARTPRAPRTGPLRDARVQDVMTREVICVDENAPFKQIVDTLARNRVSAVPVLDSAGRVLGVVSECDLIAKVAVGGDLSARVGKGHTERKRARRKARGETARELMSAPAITVAPDRSVVDAARRAARAHVHHLPVVDEEQHIVGIVTRSDLLRVFLRGDEEIHAYLTDVLIRRRLLLDPHTIDVAVADGVVAIGGRLDRKRLVAPLLEAVRGVAGVVAVHDQLTYALDDTVPPPRVPLY